MKHIQIAGYQDETQNYRKALARLGARPEVSLRLQTAFSCDALLLPGGGDLALCLGAYEAAPACPNSSFSPGLDLRQAELLALYLRQNKPVLGICKGMQLLNVFFGGTLFFDLPTARGHRFCGRDQYHPVLAVPGSFPERLYGRRFLVNSAHHQGIFRPGKGLSVLCHAPDGVAEVIAHDRLPVFGVQWHPERLRPKKAPGVCSVSDGSLLLAWFLAGLYDPSIFSRSRPSSP